MNEQKAKLIKRFVEKSRKFFPLMSYRRVKKYYIDLNLFQKIDFIKKMKDLVSGKVVLKDE